MPELRIKATQEVHYWQVINVTEEEKESILNHEGSSTQILEDAYDVLSEKIDHSEVFDAESEYYDLEIEELGI